jgi:hypothetical protein
MYIISIGARVLCAGSLMLVARRAGAGSRDLEISTHFNFGRRGDLCADRSLFI